MYLGTTITTIVSHKAKNNQISQAKRATYGLLNEIMKFDLPDLYDKLSMPIMLYGCETWGFKNTQQVNVTCNSFLQSIL